MKNSVSLCVLCVTCLVVASSAYQAVREIDAWTGQNVTLECRTYDNPHIALWKRGHGVSSTLYTDNNKVDPYLQHRLKIFINIQKNGYNLQIYKVTPEDTDLYTCVTQKDGKAFYHKVTLNVSGFPLNIFYLIASIIGGIVGAFVLIMFCVLYVIFFVNKIRKTAKGSLDFPSATSSNTDSQQNPYDEIDVETAFSDDTRTGGENGASFYLTVLNDDSIQNSFNSVECIEDSVVIPSVKLVISSDSCAKIRSRGDLQVNEYHLYEEITDELLGHVKQVACNNTVKKTEYYDNNNQENVSSSMTNNIYRNTYETLLPKSQTPLRIYSKLDNL